MKQFCPTKIACKNNVGALEFDSPITNLSSEAPDPIIFPGFGWTIYDPHAIPPLAPGLYILHDCANVTYSVTSQQLAELLAMLNARLCAAQADGMPQCGNSLQSITVTCPNGAAFQFILEANTFVSAATNCQLVVDQWALAWAGQQLQVNSNCMFGTFSGALRSGCLNQDYLDYVFISFPPHPTVELPAEFTLTSGSLPPGIVMTTTATRAIFTGIPTATGIYHFTIQAFVTQGAIQTISHKSYIIAVLEINNIPTAARVGTAYSFQFTAIGGTSPYTFAVTSGSLPSGLTMSTSGLITGSPTTVGTTNFTVAVTDSS